MAWEMYYNSEPIVGDVSYESMQTISDGILAFAKGGGGWYDLEFKLDDGIGIHRLYISPNPVVSFHQSAD